MVCQLAPLRCLLNIWTGSEHMKTAKVKESSPTSKYLRNLPIECNNCHTLLNNQFSIVITPIITNQPNKSSTMVKAELSLASCDFDKMRCFQRITKKAHLMAFQ